MTEISDKDRIDFLEAFFGKSMDGNSYIRIALRTSLYGRGARLHVTRDKHWEPNFTTVRDAIDHALQENHE